MSLLDTALAYAEGGWFIFPCQWAGPKRKNPLTPHGYQDASTNSAIVRGWWQRWPGALIGAATGRGFVVLDIDCKSDRDGRATLGQLGFAELPATLTARTASGGWHLYFSEPTKPVHNTQGERGRGIGKGLDWRGVGGYVILPAPGSGYVWVESTLAMPLAPVPAALMPKDAPPMVIGTAATCNKLAPYGSAALRSAAHKIMYAPNGEQEATLSSECYSIGRLAGAGGVPAHLALEVLRTAGRTMPSYDPRKPWKTGAIDKKVERCFADGFARPRPSQFEIEQALDQGEAGNA